MEGKQGAWGECRGRVGGGVLLCLVTRHWVCWSGTGPRVALLRVPDTDTRGHLESGLEAAKRTQSKRNENSQPCLWRVWGICYSHSLHLAARGCRTRRPITSTQLCTQGLLDGACILTGDMAHPNGQSWAGALATYHLTPKG